MELGLILGRNLEKPGKRQNLGVFQGFSRFNFLFLSFSRFSRSPGNPGHELPLLYYWDRAFFFTKLLPFFPLFYNWDRAFFFTKLLPFFPLFYNWDRVYLDVMNVYRSFHSLITWTEIHFGTKFGTKFVL